MTKFHVHVYKVVGKMEFDLETGSEEEAKRKALAWTENIKDITVFPNETWDESECQRIAIIPEEINQLKLARGRLITDGGVWENRFNRMSKAYDDLAESSMEVMKKINIILGGEKEDRKDARVWWKRFLYWRGSKEE